MSVAQEAPPDAPGARAIARFAAPLVAGSLITQATQFLVVAVLGSLGGSALYLRAVYVPVAFLFLAVNMCMGITLQVLTARRTGAGQPEAVPALLGSVARVGLLVYLALGVAVVAGAGPLAALLTVPDAQRQAFTGFLALMALVSPLGMTGELGAAALRGTGATGRSLLLTTASAAVTLTCLAVLTQGPYASVLALPWSLALGGAVETALAPALLRRDGPFRLRDLARRERGVLRPVTAIGVPVAASVALLFVVEFVLLRVVAPFGQSAVAGFSLAYTVQAVFIVPAMSYASSVAILVNQLRAAGHPEHARAVIRRGAALVGVGYALLTVVLAAAGPAAIGALPLEGGTTEEAVRFMTLVGPTFGCTGLALVALGVMEQTGHGPIAICMNTAHFGCVLGIGAWAARHVESTDGLYAVLALGAAIGALLSWPVAWRLVYRAEAGTVPARGGTR
ncbi:multidrug transporter MatE [Streptomyces sp. OfavH-34-F]|uniref:MATE family efflux transporter n=1 Tax=Streptomyces sp. OfavH-34-F TaxID=2917760 RepID=UPI001EF3C0C4|nr:MATE family efflux transporter [Streptomyces sp. OfavH-34-F]MCG7524789.1 multidrug transporter MatE [Streptomyces sp. OfavH-34-F]